MPSNTVSRQRQISELSAREFDLCVVGGGIHGASVARDAALRGYRVALLEKYDFAYGTSSRSSKMLHGGVRYLEQGDFRLVRSALQERNYYLSAAPHLCRVQQFYFPIIRGRSRSGFLTRIGLTIYDTLSSFSGVKSKIPHHSSVSTDDPDRTALEGYGLKADQMLSYFDGQMDDARLVVETVRDAIELGAVALNYAEVEAITKDGAGWRVGWRDRLAQGGEEGCAELRCKVVVNAAGPWAPGICKLAGVAAPKPFYSRGTHLIFDRVWNHPGLILPTDVKGRYYFVWPYFSPIGKVTLVGTTDVELSQNEESPQPSEQEVKELLELLQRDLPRSGLNRESLVNSFAGVRILAATKPGLFRRIFSGAQSSASDVSREELIEQSDGVITLVGGKYTSARKTAELIVDKAERGFGVSESEIRKRHRSFSRPLPGGRESTPEALKDLVKRLTEHNLSRGISPEKSSQLAQCATNRFGMSASELLRLDLSAISYDPEKLPCMVEEVIYCLEVELAHNSEDILRRRLGLSHENVRLEELYGVLGQLNVPIES